MKSVSTIESSRHSYLVGNPTISPTLEKLWSTLAASGHPKGADSRQGEEPAGVLGYREVVADYEKTLIDAYLGREHCEPLAKRTGLRMPVTPVLPEVTTSRRACPPSDFPQ